MSASDDDAAALVLSAGDYFCANPDCVLHVREGDPGVHGRGNWAMFDGRTASRSRYGERMLCDECGRASLAGARSGAVD